MEVTCPPVMNKEETNDIVCTIDTAAMSSVGCISPPSTVSFYRINSTQQKTLCTTSYTTTECNQQPKSGQCGCTAISGNLKTFTLKLVGDEADQRGSNIICSPCFSTPPIQPSSVNCNNLQAFAETCNSNNQCSKGDCRREGTELKCDCYSLYKGALCKDLIGGYVAAIIICILVALLVPPAVIYGLLQCKKTKQCCYK